MAMFEPSGVAQASAGESTAPLARRRASNGVVVAYVAAYFAMYLALLTPALSTLAVKVAAITTPETRVADLGLITGVGAFFAFVVNPIAGALSDRTTGRFGMRKPWVLLGAVLGVAGLAIVASATSVWMIVIGWALTQAAFNAAQAALQAFLPDQVEERRRAKVAGWLGIAQNVAPLIGITLATIFASAGLTSLWLILIPAAIGLIGMIVFVLVMTDRRLQENAEKFHLGAFLRGFWVSPRRHPDFAWAFTGRFLMLLGFAAYNNYQVFFLLDRFGFDITTALSWQLRLLLLQTVVLVLAASIGGWLSDRLGRRKSFVIAATVLAGIALIVFSVAQDPNLLFVAAALFGAGTGAYFAIDLALVTDVLPNRETEAAKNMGVFNIANSLPQSLAPALAPLVLAVGSTTTSNYTLLFVIAAVVIIAGAASTMFIKGAR